MKQPIILVNEGCSMSSFTSFVIRNLIEAHGYPIEIPGNNEMYVPAKNPHYKEGMSIVDLLEKGFLLSGEGLPGRHSTKFILIDSNAQILGYYEYSDKEDFNDLIADATYLLNRL